MSENRVELLIETYWNVNKFGLAFASSSFVCINRNILECKYEPKSNDPSVKFSINRNILECKCCCCGCCCGCRMY